MADISNLTDRAKRRNPNFKGSTKRYQETVELLQWKYSKMSEEEELKDTISLGDMSNYGDDDDMDILPPWTYEDKNLIAGVCKNKPLEETLLIQNDYQIFKEANSIRIGIVDSLMGQIKINSSYPITTSTLLMDQIQEDSFRLEKLHRAMEYYSDMFLNSMLDLNGNKMTTLFDHMKTNSIIKEFIRNIERRKKTVKSRGKSVMAHSVFPSVKHDAL